MSRFSRISSIKVMRIDRGAAIHPFESFSPDRQYAVLMLQDTVDHEEGRTDHGRSLAIVEIGPDDDVGDAGLVFEREKHKAFGGSRTLPRDHHAGHAHTAAVACAREIHGAQHTTQREIPPVQRHRMRANR